MTKQFLRDLLVAKCEKDVEEAYRTLLKKKCKGATVSSPYGTDGLLEAFPNIRTLLEFKFNSGLKSKTGQCSVLIQALYYLKKFEAAGDRLPSTIFVGDKKECFALKTNSVVKYLDSPIDWTIAPSSAAKHNGELLHAMVEDIDILPFVYDVDERFNVHEVLEQIRAFGDNIIRRVRVTGNNIETIFDYFDLNVLLPSKKLSPNDRANLFIQLIINPDGNYLHPKKNGILVNEGGHSNVRVRHDLFLSFFAHFEGERYSPREKELFTAFLDRLVESATRRRKGEFFTPRVFAAEAHKCLSRVLGEDWREEYVVWDCCAGTFNLTRDYKFKELYSSTIEKGDLDTAKQMKYNPEATCFQYDFLNDGIDELGFDDKMPEGLVEAIESGRKVVFLINPPFATASNKQNKRSAGGDDNKEGVARTKVGQLMSEEKWGGCSQNLYAQFLYRILQYRKINKNIKVGFYAPPLFISGASYKTFRERFFEYFGFADGFLFEAKHFSDVSAGWGVSFTIYEGKPNNKPHLLDVLDIDAETFELKKIGRKEIYNTDDVMSGNDWLKDIKTPRKNMQAICMKSCLSVGARVKSVSKDYLGTLVCDTNSAMKNIDAVFILSGPVFSNFGNNEITAENFERSIALYAARKLIVPNWIDQKDEYLAPDMGHKDWEQFVKDCLVYALFSGSAQQSSFRDIEYDGKSWDVKNELFWMSKKEIMKLADKGNYDELYRDAKTQNERFVYKLLADGWYEDLSEDAKEILDMATALVKDSIKARKSLSHGNPEYGLDCYDAGYAQLKLVWNKFFKKQHDLFKEKFVAFEARMRGLVHKLGFLR